MKKNLLLFLATACVSIAQIDIEATDVKTGVLSIARIPIGTTAGTTAAGDDARIAFASGPTLGKLSVFEQAATRVVRVYYGGTSIENSTVAGGRQFLEALKARYGDSGNLTQGMKDLGGGPSVNLSGWLKQPSGTLGFYRIRGDSGSSDLDFFSMCKQVVVRTSKETTGGSFDVYVDGVFSVTINCSGSQSFNNETVIDFTSTDFRKITLKAPASGYAYVEAIDFNENKNGIHVIDGTQGGSTFTGMVNVGTATGSQAASIPIVGYNGVDSYMLKTSANGKPDVVIFAWVVNDSQLSGSFGSVYQPALDRVVQQTAANGQQLVLVIEMGGQYTMPAFPYNAGFKQIRALLQSYASQPHVTVLDWHAASQPPADSVTDQSVWQTWASKYYAGTITSLAAGTSSGDFIHPGNAGHALVSQLLSQSAGVPSLGQVGFSDTSTMSRSHIVQALGARDLSTSGRENPSGQFREEPDSLGIPQRLRAIGPSRYAMANKYTTTQTAWVSDTQINYAPALNNSIAASSTSDEWGKYLVLNLATYTNTATFAAGQSTTYTWVVGPGSGYVRVRNYANNAGTEQFVYGRSVGVVDSISYNNETDRPQLIHVTLQTVGQTYTQLTGKFYAFYATPTAFPCIPSREFDTMKEVGGPLYVVGDPLATKAVLGQTYYESINSKTIEKVCVGRRVYKPQSSDWHALYRIQNRSVSNLIRPMPLGGTVTTTAYDERAGGSLQTTTANPPVVSLPQAVITADAVYTITGRVFGAAQFGLYAFNGSLNRTLVWHPSTNTWTETTSQDPFVVAGNDGEQFAVTFPMPSAALMGAQTDWSINLRQIGGAPSSGSWGLFTITEGSSAGI